MNASPAYIVHPPDAEARLAEIGLPPVEVFRATGAAGLTSYLGTPRLAPRVAAGQAMRNDAVAAFREITEVFGWYAVCDGNLEPTVHKESGVRVILLSGDESTGNPNTDPLSRHPRGSRGRIQVDRNQLTLDGLGWSAAAPSRPTPSGSLEWALVHYVDPAGRGLQLEVSLPRSLADDNRVDGWHERILLDAIGFNDPLVGRRWDNMPPAPALEVSVERRRTVG